MDWTDGLVALLITGVLAMWVIGLRCLAPAWNDWRRNRP